MKNASNVLEVEDLQSYFFTERGVLRAVDGVSFNLRKQSTLGIVGESGSGKSVTSLSIMGLLASQTGRVVGGSVRLATDGDAVDLLNLSQDALRNVRGREIAMIFQEPSTALNPVFTIGHQINEVLSLHLEDLSIEEVRLRTIALLTQTGIARAEGVYNQYPHELSGGMRQRVMIAMAIACKPKVIIADEPTTALDVTIQAQILDLLVELKEQTKASIILITHDLGVIAHSADDVLVMYAGKVFEEGSLREVFKGPRHPYTVGLIKSRPDNLGENEELYSIPGQVPVPIDLEHLCYFRDRCPRRKEKCNKEYPPYFKISPTHRALCWYYDEVDL